MMPYIPEKLLILRTGDRSCEAMIFDPKKKNRKILSYDKELEIDFKLGFYNHGKMSSDQKVLIVVS